LSPPSAEPLPPARSAKPINWTTPEEVSRTIRSPATATSVAPRTCHTEALIRSMSTDYDVGDDRAVLNSPWRILLAVGP
jgi:hypothetical protein